MRQQINQTIQERQDECRRFAGAGLGQSHHVAIVSGSAALIAMAV